MATSLPSPITQKYSGRNYDFPSDNIDPKKKLKTNYALDAMEAIFSYYTKDSTSIGYSRRFDFQIQRLYGEGRQPTEKYMDFLCPKGDDGVRKGYMNISWDIFSVAPKFRALVIGIFEKVSHDVSVDAIDEMSGGMKEEMKFSLWAEKQLSPFKQEINEILGEEVAPVEDQYMPETLEELEVFSEAGGFKLNSEISMEKALRLSFYSSRWSEIKTKLLEDAFDLGVICVKDYVDKQTQKVKTRYVNPANLVVDYSRDKTFRGIKYEGELVEYTLDDFIAENGHLNEDEMKDALKQIWTAFTDTALNPDYPFNFDYYNVYTQQQYRQFSFYALDAEWFSTDTIVKKKRKWKDGTTRMKREKYKYRNDKDAQTTRLKNVYRAKWPIGTSVIWDNGQQFDIPRPVGKQKKREANLSYHTYRIANKSMCAAIIPQLDSIQQAWLRMQNVIATAAPPGVAIEIDKLMDLSLTGKAGENLKPIDILQIRKDTGNLVYASEDSTGKMRGQQGKPIQELKGGYQGAVQEEMNYIIQASEMIREITGLNRSVDASSPQADVSVTSSKMAMGATENILQGISVGMTNVKEETAKNMSLRWQITAKYQKETFQDAIPALGKTSMEVIKIGSDISFAEYGLRLVLKPNDEEKAKIENAAIVSMESGKAGGVGIKLSDYVKILSFLESGQIKFASIYLSHREEKYTKEKQQAQADNEKANTERALQVEDQKAKATEATAQAAHDREFKMKGQEHLWQIEIDNNKHNNTMKELGVTRDKDVDKSLIAAEASVENQQTKSNTELTKEAMRSEKTNKEQK